MWQKLQGVRRPGISLPLYLTPLRSWIWAGSGHTSFWFPWLVGKQCLSAVPHTHSFVSG